MQKIMKPSKQIIASLICLVVLIGSLFIANQSALAEFKRGTVQRSRFSSTVVLDRTFGKPGGYIPERALRNANSRRVNVYDGHEKKIGYAKKDYRTGGINTYDEKGRKTGYYRKALGSPNY
jgi:hypothetical protein